MAEKIKYFVEQTIEKNEKAICLAQIHQLTKGHKSQNEIVPLLQKYLKDKPREEVP